MTNGMKVSQFMVRSPIAAEPRQPISFVRQVMLSNSYSFLPLWFRHKSREGWWFLGESEVAKYLRVAASNEERKKCLAATVASAVEEGMLSLIETQPVDPQALVRETVILLQGSTLLVVGQEDPTRLLGILTAFDVL
jgi:CBS domain-containing protein